MMRSTLLLLVLRMQSLTNPVRSTICSAAPCCCIKSLGHGVYGSRCAHWDAPDEQPWCFVEQGTCGKDTFQSDRGHFWSHRPCGGNGDSYDSVQGAKDQAQDAHQIEEKVPVQSHSTDREALSLRGAYSTAISSVPTLEGGKVSYEVERGGALLPHPVVDPMVNLPATMDEVADISILLSTEDGVDAVRADVANAMRCAMIRNLTIEALVHDTQGKAAQVLGADSVRLRAEETVRALTHALAESNQQGLSHEARAETKVALARARRVASSSMYVLTGPRVSREQGISQLARIARGKVLGYFARTSTAKPGELSCSWVPQRADDAAAHLPPELCWVRRSAFLRAQTCGSGDACKVITQCSWTGTGDSIAKSARANKARLSFLIMYWGGSQRTSQHMQTLTKVIIPRLFHAAKLAQVKAEVLVNIDSRHIRDGDIQVMHDAGVFTSVHDQVRALMSPNIHELRAYNRLALLSEAEYIVLLQDDNVPGEASADRWIQAGVATLDANPFVANIGYKQGMYLVSWFYADMGLIGGPQGQKHFPKAADKVRCRDRKTGLGIEALRCVDLGPLLLRRNAFWEIGGFNETVTDRGKAGSVHVDCDLSARLYLHGLASVLIGYTDKWPPEKGKVHNALWEPHFTAEGIENEHAAWDAKGMQDRHRARQLVFANRYEVVGPAFTAINAAMRQANSHFECHPQRMEVCGEAGCIQRWQDQSQPQCYTKESKTVCWKYPFNMMDCGITENNLACERTQFVRDLKPADNYEQGCQLRDLLHLPKC